MKKIKAKNVSVGKKLQLRCRIRSARPDPSITWTKDGVPISGKTKGVQIRKKKYEHIERENERKRVKKEKQKSSFEIEV